MATMMKLAVTALIRSATPRIRATPTASMPSMNSASTKADPARALNTVRSGPALTWPRKPEVGDPPTIQAFAEAVV